MATQTRVSLDVTDTLQPLIERVQYLQLSDRRMKGIIASTLTATAAEAQKAFKESVSSVFDRPKPFTVNSTYIERATAENLSATVGFKEKSNSDIGAGKYLQAELHGGERADKRFERALQAAGLLPKGYQATPGPSARLDAYGNQSRADIEKILTSLKAFTENGYLAEKSGKRKGRLQDFFVVRPGERRGGLHPGIFQYVGEGKGRAVRKVMNFVPSTRYFARINMEAIVIATINEHFERLFIRYTEESLARAQSKLLKSV